jgi:CCR4-NOT transcription complex subunit 1
LDVCQELQALTTALDNTPYGVALDLAALAARREFLNLEKWLTASFNVRGLPFVAACLQFLSERAATPPEALHATGRMAMAPDTMATFFKVVHHHLGLLPPEMQEEAKAVYAAAAAVHHKLQAAEGQAAAAAAAAATTTGGGGPGGGGGGGAGAPGPGGLQAEVFAPDIEEEANAYFQKIYTSQQSIEEVVQMLQGFKTSAKPREQEIFACMIHNLFDEYRFFPKYPVSGHSSPHASFT